MSLLQSIILGFVQGLTEFFPVSSSAHLKIVKLFLKIEAKESYFDFVCHLGTLLALSIFLRREALAVIKSPRKIALFTLALLPLIPTYFLLKPLWHLASHPNYLGYSLMITACFLFIASRKRELISSKKWHHVLCIGIMQTMALIPGISRSGSTICAARVCGWSWRDAALFSYLLAIPTILGGELIEIYKNKDLQSISYACYFGGALASFGMGLITVRFIFWVYEKEKIKPFAWYCLGLGLFVWGCLNG